MISLIGCLSPGGFTLVDFMLQSKPTLPWENLIIVKNRGLLYTETIQFSGVNRDICIQSAGAELRPVIVITISTRYNRDEDSPYGRFVHLCERVVWPS
jgi:hypothetical protein